MQAINGRALASQWHPRGYEDNKLEMTYQLKIACDDYLANHFLASFFVAIGSWQEYEGQEYLDLREVYWCHLLYGF